MSAAYIERTQAYFSALDGFELEEESSSEEEESSSSEEEEEEEDHHHHQQQDQEQKEQRVSAEQAPGHTADVALASPDEDDANELVLVGDGSGPTVYGRGSSGSGYDSAELFDAVVGAGSAALSAALSKKRRRHTASTESLTLTDVIDDSCDLSLSPVADDRPSSPEADTPHDSTEAQWCDGDSSAKRIRLILPTVTARKAQALKDRPASNRLLLLKAISKGDAAAVKTLLAKGVSLNFFTAEGQTPLGHRCASLALATLPLISHTNLKSPCADPQPRDSCC
jgi:hypothetical protein